MPFSDLEKGPEQAMERIGIEPMTSGLQILSNPGVGGSWEVATALRSHAPLRTRSPWFTIRRRDLTQI